MLTNSLQKNKRGPKEAYAGNVYGFAHQAYWGFRFLAEKRKTFWQQILNARTPKAVQEVGRACSQAGSMPKAGYGARGLMTWLTSRKVAMQVIKAKQHRRYPDSDRSSSEDRRMIFLGVAVAAGIWEIEFSTALRKLAQAGLGPEYLAKEVHRMDGLHEMMKRHVWAEPVGNYFIPSSQGQWEQVRELPCKVPANWEGGYIVHGYGPSGLQSTFSRTLPSELVDPPLSDIQGPVTETIVSSLPSARTSAPNSVRCHCGAEICAHTRKLALKALAEHKRTVHGTRRSRRAN